ncbi:hypothetical protein Fmac_014770 [Flemingia macrophylla]|uniref:Uncharacterized protein n=1 Tax=Flemingia macrophylla TaxID=520843 RepID=A0ABD1MD67_9FABA
MTPKPSSNASSVSLNFDFGSSAPSRDAKAFDDLLASAGSDARRADSPFDFDFMYAGLSGRSSNSPPPPVYVDDIFDCVPSLKISSSKVKFDDVFAATSDGVGAAAFEDLLGGFGKEPKSSGGNRSDKDRKCGSDFDDLLVGFGNGSGNKYIYIYDVFVFGIGIVQ